MTFVTGVGTVADDSVHWISQDGIDLDYFISDRNADMLCF